MKIYNDLKQITNRYNYPLYWNGKSRPDAKGLKPAAQIKEVKQRQWVNIQGNDICEEEFKLTIWDTYPTDCEGFENACEKSRDEIVAYKRILRRMIKILVECYDYELIPGESGAFVFTEIDYPYTANCMIGVSVECRLRYCKAPNCCEETDFNLTGIKTEIPNYKKR